MKRHLPAFFWVLLGASLFLLACGGSGDAPAPSSDGDYDSRCLNPDTFCQLNASKCRDNAVVPCLPLLDNEGCATGESFPADKATVCEAGKTCVERHLENPQDPLTALCVAADESELDGDQTADGDPAADGEENAESEAAADGDPSVESDFDADSAPVITACGQLTPGTAPCTAQAGDANILIRATLLTPEGMLVGGELLIGSDGKIACVACDCSKSEGAAGATLITCPGAVVSPGLINAHDHITFAQNLPGSWTARYDHRHEWRKGQNGKPKITVPGTSYSPAETKEAVVAWGELRHLLAGTTSLAGSGGISGLLRNIDTPGKIEGLDIGVIDNNTFPLDDSDGQNVLESCTGYGTLDSPNLLSETCYLPHVAEGVNQRARNEFLCLSSTDKGGHDLTAANSTFVHSIGLLAPDGALMAARRTSVIWSPRSNVSLYGNTAQVTLYKHLGIPLALGTDWTASGSVNVVRELACADYLNKTNFNGTFSDRDLWRMVTEGAAAALHIDNKVGLLKVGLVADIAIFKSPTDTSKSAYRAIIDSTPADTLLVLRGGLPMVGETSLMSLIPGGQTDCETMPNGVCGAAKTLCLKREVGKDFATLDEQNKHLKINSGDTTTFTAYGLFFCATPDNEPTCIPSRPGEYTGVPSSDDRDGDGVKNDVDNCPDIFNPARPLDGGKQPDFDGDGMGDVCDPCPLDKDNTRCQAVDPNDRDGDGKPNDRDNCPTVSNPDQKDDDGDGKGDACDACPNVSNPLDQPCPASLYAIKQKTTAVGSVVSVEGVVTGVTANSPTFFIQVPEAAQDTTLLARFSGLYIYLPAANPNKITIPKAGDLVQIWGTVKSFHDQLELDTVTKLTVLSSANPLPAAVVVTSDKVSTGGADAAAYEGVLVTVNDGLVSDIAPAPSASDTAPSNEYVLDGKLRVNDFFYKTSPFPYVGDHLKVTGILRYGNDNSKLEPRAASDITVISEAPPTIAGFGPANSAVGVGETNTTTIPVLALTLTRAPASDTWVPITSADPTSLTVQGGGVTILAGQTTANVLVNGLAQSAGVMLSASLNSSTQQATVRVVGATEIPLIKSISPSPATLAVNGKLTLTVTLDIPAPTGGATISIGASPPNLLTIPATVSVAANTLSATFEVTALAATGPATLTLTLGMSVMSVEVTVTAAPAGSLMLSEVFYNPAGLGGTTDDDKLEWVELYNGSNAAIDLAGYSLGYGGTSYAYAKFALSGTIAPGACIVVGGPTSSALNFSPIFALAADFNPDIQNSGTATEPADGLALFHLAASAITATSVPLDSVVYGAGANSSKLIDKSGAISKVDVGDCGKGKSIARSKEGWKIQATPNPGVCALAR